jgi:hypothetical protein
MEQIIIPAAKIIFAFSSLFFTVYSIVALYSLSVYGQSRTLAVSVVFVYSILGAGLMGWGWILIWQLP